MIDKYESEIIHQESGFKDKRKKWEVFDPWTRTSGINNSFTFRRFRYKWEAKILTWFINRILLDSFIIDYIEEGKDTL